MKEFTDKNYKKLADAIIDMAAKDYVSFRKKLFRNPKDEIAQANVKKCEKFFLSDWFIGLCPLEIDGKWFLSKLDQMAKEKPTVQNRRKVLDENVIKKMYMEGSTLTAIAKVSGCSAATIDNFLKREGLKVGKVKVKKEKTERKKIAAKKLLGVPRKEIPKEVLEKMYLLEKKTMEKIAEELGVSISTVDTRLREHGIPKRSAGRQEMDKPSKEELLQMVNEGLSGREIAKKCDLSSWTIYAELKKYNIQTKHGNKRKAL